MFFSIIIPVYNVEKYIRQCLDSILNQEFKDYEIILLDDGSTDSSGIICDEYAKMDKRIRVIHKDNEGLLITRRRGLKEARGEYIYQMDSDDYVAAGMLSEIAGFINGQSLDILLFGYNVINDSGEIIEKHYDLFDDKKVFTYESKKIVVYKLATTTWINNTFTRVIKKNIIDVDADYSYYCNVKMGEDLLQGIADFGNANTIGYLARPLYNYRYNLKGMSKNYNISYLRDYMVISELLKKLCHDASLDEKEMSDFFNRYLKDVYKYLMRFICKRIKKQDYKKLCREIDDNTLFSEARVYANKKNKILRFITRPKICLLTYPIISIFWKKKLFI